MKINGWIIKAGLPVLLLGRAAFAAQIDGVEFKTEGDQSVVEITGQDLGKPEQEFKRNPPQLVLTFDNTTLADEAAKKLDTSSFKNGVLQISTYTLEKTGQARVVVDLKKAGPYSVDEGSAMTVVKFHDSGTEASQTAKKEENLDNKELLNKELLNKELTNKEPTNKELAHKELANKVLPKEDTLGQIISAQNEKKFTGSPITLKLKDADVHEVLRMISDTSGFNIIIHPSVTGKLSLSLDHVPWDQALEVVLSTLKLSAERNDSVLRVMPRDVFIGEKQQKLDEQKLSAAVAPRITRVFPISYADLAELSTLLQGFANAQNLTPGNSGVAATILTDKTSQSLIIRDSAENLDRLKKMIEILDVQTPQVLVEAKVVEATSTFSKTIGGSFGIGGARYGFAFGGPITLAGVPSIGKAGVLDPGGSKGGIFQGADVFAINGRSISIGATLNLAEQENKVKVVSSPRTVVLSGKSASINQARTIGIQVQLPGTGGSPGGTMIQAIQANTKLNVTPRVTNDGSVMMKLDLTRDVLNTSDPNAPVAEPRQMNTEVIVDSGTTLVIGGVLNIDENHSEQGMPFLRKIPLLGAFFGSEGDSNAKSELMFFVTPRVLNPKKTGLITEENAAKM